MKAWVVRYGDPTKMAHRVDLLSGEKPRVPRQNLLLNGVMNDDFSPEFGMRREEPLSIVVGTGDATTAPG